MLSVSNKSSLLSVIMLSAVMLNVVAPFYESGSFCSFQFKYQLNLDGTVAAYRFPFLLAGNSVVLKQDSKYVEHFYNQVGITFKFCPTGPGGGGTVMKLRVE